MSSTLLVASTRSTGLARRQRRLFSSFILAFCFSSVSAFDGAPGIDAARAADEPPPPPVPPSKAPKQVISEMVDAVFAVLRDDKLKTQPKLRMKRLREITDKAMNWEAMARSSVGHHWRTITEHQRVEFISVFKELLARQYRDDVDRFQGTEFVSFDGETKNGELVTVKTTLKTASGERVPIHYVLNKSNNLWLVEDVSVEGVSLINHYRKTFDRFLVNQSFDVLLAKLKAKYGD